MLSITWGKRLDRPETDWQQSILSERGPFWWFPTLPRIQFDHGKGIIQGRLQFSPPISYVCFFQHRNVNGINSTSIQLEADGSLDGGGCLHLDCDGMTSVRWMGNFLKCWLIPRKQFSVGTNLSIFYFLVGCHYRYWFILKGIARMVSVIEVRTNKLSTGIICVTEYTYP